MAEFATNAKGNAALTTGIIGTAGVGLGLLGNLLGMGGPGCANNEPLVTRHELTMAQELSAKDGKIALLEADAYTNQKISETTAYLMGEIKDLSCEVRRNRDEQTAINTQQAVYNGTMTATVGCIQGQVADLLALTKRVVPNGSVCPGWGNVTITPAAAPTTAG
jgi:hypothetical protein